VEGQRVLVTHRPHPGPRALIYFGGNAQDVSLSRSALYARVAERHSAVTVAGAALVAGRRCIWRFSPCRLVCQWPRRRRLRCASRPGDARCRAAGRLRHSGGRLHHPDTG
jgi:hypothetical protein